MSSTQEHKLKEAYDQVIVEADDKQKIRMSRLYNRLSRKLVESPTTSFSEEDFVHMFEYHTKSSTTMYCMELRLNCLDMVDEVIDFFGVCEEAEYEIKMLVTSSIMRIDDTELISFKEIISNKINCTKMVLSVMDHLRSLNDADE